MPSFFNSQVANWKEHKAVCGVLGKGAKTIKENVVSELIMFISFIP